MFLHHLAWRFGIPVDELAKKLSQRAITYWRAFMIMNWYGDYPHKGMSVREWKTMNAPPEVKGALALLTACPPGTPAPPGKAGTVGMV